MQAHREYLATMAPKAYKARRAMSDRRVSKAHPETMERPGKTARRDSRGFRAFPANLEPMAQMGREFPLVELPAKFWLSRVMRISIQAG